MAIFKMEYYINVFFPGSFEYFFGNNFVSNDENSL